MLAIPVPGWVGGVCSQEFCCALEFFAESFALLLRASGSPIAIACFRLLTRPPFPAFPERNVPCSLRRIALLTDLPAAFPYFGIVASLSSRLSSNATASELGRRCVTSCKAPSKSMYVPPTCRAYTMYRIANRAHSQ